MTKNDVCVDLSVCSQAVVTHESRIGNHLKLYKSLEDQTVVDPVTGAGYSFEAGELVHIMDSHKVRSLI